MTVFKMPTMSNVLLHAPSEIFVYKGRSVEVVLTYEHHYDSEWSAYLEIYVDGEELHFLEELEELDEDKWRVYLSEMDMLCTSIHYKEMVFSEEFSGLMAYVLDRHHLMKLAAERALGK